MPHELILFMIFESLYLWNYMAEQLQMLAICMFIAQKINLLDHAKVVSGQVLSHHRKYALVSLGGSGASPK